MRYLSVPEIQKEGSTLAMNTSSSLAPTPTPTPPGEKWYNDIRVSLTLGAIGLLYVVPFLYYVGYTIYRFFKATEKTKIWNTSLILGFKKVIKLLTLKDVLEVAFQNNKYVKRTVYFIIETVQSKLVPILVLSIVWAMHVREEVVNKDGSAYKEKVRNFEILNTSVTGLLTFLLTMRLNNALTANRAGYDCFGTTCGHLEIFHQRTVAKEIKNVSDLAIFIPYVIKHEMRGTFRLEDCVIKDKETGNKFKLKKKIEEEEFSKIPEGGVCEHIEQKILVHLSNNKTKDGTPAWEDEPVMRAWTNYRQAANSIGGTLNYGAPVSFSIVVWLALGVYIYTTPYLIPADSGTTQATITSAVSVLCLLLLHINAESVANPFESSETYQTVTQTAEDCTNNLLLFHKKHLKLDKTDSKVNLKIF